MNIRSLNTVTLSDVYFISLQIDIIQVVSECQFISIIDCAEFFYQWKIHSADKHKLIVVNHREQEIFNVIVMRFRNSSSYVQKQINRVFRSYKDFSRAYIDDIVIFFRTEQEHIDHLQKIFNVLTDNNIVVNSLKTYIEFSSITLLRQRVTFLNLSTNAEKLKAISNLTFSRTLEKLEIYLELTKWFKQYVSNYAVKSESLQNRKIELLKSVSKIDNVRKSYASKVKIQNSSSKEIASFDYIQHHLFNKKYFVHFEFERQFYIDLNSSDKNIDVMIYHIKRDYANLKNLYSSRQTVESIMFLNRLISSTESRYWSTELKIADLVWMLRKIRHLIESFKSFTIVYTDHEVSLAVAKQTSLTTSFIDKLNLRLIRTSNYIQRFDLLIKHKPERLHLMSNALSRLFTKMQVKIEDKSISNNEENELDVLFTIFMAEMNKDLKEKFILRYQQNSTWQKISDVIDASEKNHTNISFLRVDNIIYRREISDNSSFVPRRMCVSAFMIKEILIIVHNESNDHSEFDHFYERINSFWYIKELIRYLKNYIAHCSQCKINRIRRHKSYEFLQSILSSFISFHTLIIDFILTMLVSHIDMNCVMSVTDKYSKRITILVNKDTWSTDDWFATLLKRLDLANWDLPKTIISNKDRKFLFDLWTDLFKRLKIKLLYSTAYHSQTNEASERINQTFEIALRYHVQALKDFKDWFTIVKAMQRNFNNAITFTNKSSNEICYKFISFQSSNLIKSITFSTFSSSIKYRLIVQDVIAMTQIASKRLYDQKHQSIQMNVENWALIRLHKNYNIFVTAILEKKLSQQYVDSFQIIQRIENLAYKLKIFDNWRIWSVFTISQLESSFEFVNDFYHRTQSSSESLIVKDDTNQVKSFEINRLISKRQTKRREIEYLIRWRNYDLENDAWKNLSKLSNAKELMKNYEKNNSISTSQITRTRKRFKFNQI